MVERVQQVLLLEHLLLMPVAAAAVLEKKAELFIAELVAPVAVVLEQIQAMILLQVQLISAVAAAVAIRWIASYHLTGVQE
jgi:hypothetical protein